MFGRGGPLQANSHRDFGHPADSTQARTEVTERTSTVARSLLFHGLPQPTLNRLAASSRSKTYHRGETLFLQGEPVRSLHVVRTGCVKLSMMNASGSEVIVGLRGPTEAVNLGPDDRPRIHEVAAEAVGPCRVLSWNLLVVQDLFRSAPVMSENVRGILARQLCDLQERYSELSSDKVERRVASMLARLAEQFGRRDHQGIEVFFSREELAQMTGTTLFTVSRLLSRWRDVGLLIPKREAVVVINIERFRACTAGDHAEAQRPVRNPVCAPVPVSRAGASVSLTGSPL